MVTVPKPGKKSTDLFWNASSGEIKLREGRCRMCQRTRRERPLTRHHLVPQRWFLGQGRRYREIRNSNANIIPLCRPCHDEIESRHPVAREMARARLRPLLTQQEITFAVKLLGMDWVNREYPVYAENAGSYEHEQGEGRCDYYEDSRVGGWASVAAVGHRFT